MRPANVRSCCVHVVPFSPASSFFVNSRNPSTPINDFGKVFCGKDFFPSLIALMQHQCDDVLGQRLVLFDVAGDVVWMIKHFLGRFPPTFLTGLGRDGAASSAQAGVTRAKICFHPTTLTCPADILSLSREREISRGIGGNFRAGVERDDPAIAGHAGGGGGARE
jgi:hypothetical protein